MTDEKAAAAETANEQQFLIQRVYLKDLSFEAPMGAKAFVSKVQPSVDQELATETTKIDKDLYEVVLKLTVTAKIEEEAAFLVEVHQAGLFFIKGIEGVDLTRVINTVCPQILFPYARETIDSSLIKGSFPPVMLPPVNFEALFAQAMAEKQAKAH
ncbi:MAG: preprotein translocase subunit SecB [Cellvibrionaceae bacterium]|jgi:preprotein translocase subunit SecB